MFVMVKERSEHLGRGLWIICSGLGFGWRGRGREGEIGKGEAVIDAGDSGFGEGGGGAG